MSFGWAVCLPPRGDSALLLFRAADERLHAQKLISSLLSESGGEVVALPSEAERAPRVRHA
jgi:hypothetical protein